jgi:hypothetical protein
VSRDQSFVRQSHTYMSSERTQSLGWASGSVTTTRTPAQERTYHTFLATTTIQVADEAPPRPISRGIEIIRGYYGWR